MKIQDYSGLIRNLPVRQQSFTTKRSTWGKAESQIPWLAELNNKIFENRIAVTISRQDVFATDDVRELIVKTIYWGYPRGMRGNHVVNIFNAMKEIETEFTLALARETNQSIDSSNFASLLELFESIEGLGISTLTKLLYFNDVTFDGHRCLILDSRIIKVLQEAKFNEFHSLRHIRYGKGVLLYTQYLQVMSAVSRDLDVNCEGLEQFLFLFGGNLKIG
ncbi:hypothetical protein SAMN05216327_11892 [Dyadobacter sp. SG02]|uniref:8-oxoguanine DNA glycosylase OGG fold protein n=1 Tax=Dyadobacter sp. SG02 TaxID=1855291 RepID=UPI0008BC8AD6|nr:hypothetical protein [Dyadobacter sp. SG02]SEJ75203.1 hypothetical protein SAMN05216327_11892 [Dyadobacter sp. SG02]